MLKLTKTLDGIENELEKFQAKFDFMIENGFKLHKCPHRNIHTLKFRTGYEWTFDEIMVTEPKTIEKYIKKYLEEEKKEDD